MDDWTSYTCFTEDFDASESESREESDFFESGLGCESESEL